MLITFDLDELPPQIRKTLTQAADILDLPMPVAVCTLLAEIGLLSADELVKLIEHADARLIDLPISASRYRYGKYTD